MDINPSLEENSGLLGSRENEPIGSGAGAMKNWL